MCLYVILFCFLLYGCAGNPIWNPMKIMFRLQRRLSCEPFVLSTPIPLFLLLNIRYFTCLTFLSFISIVRPSTPLPCLQTLLGLPTLDQVPNDN